MARTFRRDRSTIPDAGPVAPALVIIGAAALAPAGCARDRDAGAAPPPPPVVEVVEVSPSDVPVTAAWIGTTAGLVDTKIRARVSGYLTGRHYVEGSLVREGDVLFEIDRRPFEVALTQARAELTRARATQQRTEIEVNRLTPLARTGAVSQQDLDNAVQFNLANLADVQAAEARVAQAELDLSFTRIVAPVEGIAGIAQAQVGDLVGGVQAAPLTTVSTVDPIKVYFPISEQEYLKAVAQAKIRQMSEQPIAEREARLELVLADGSVHPHKGTFWVADREIDERTGTIRLGAVFPNPGNALRPGQYAKVRTVVEVARGAIVVPQRAVSELQGSYRVAVVGKDGKVSIRPVRTGPRAGGGWVIESGLEPGDAVVVEGIQKVRDGMVVTARAFAPPEPAASRAPDQAAPG